MRLPKTIELFLLSTIYIFTTTTASPVSQAPLTGSLLHHISESLFADLEELSRLVDISYCVGTTGIQKPFLCAHRCGDFKGFELVTVCTSNCAPLSRFPPHKEGRVRLIERLHRHGKPVLYSPIAAATSRSTMQRPIRVSSLRFEGRTRLPIPLWI